MKEILYEEDFNKSKIKHPDIEDEFELWVVALKEAGVSYANIQLLMGNPSKKKIREILLKYKIIENDTCIDR